MFGHNLEDLGFCTNVNDPAIYMVNIPLRQFVQKIPLLASNITQGIGCPGTHGIDFSPTNNRVYIECTSPSSCVSSSTSFGKNKTCTASTWVVDGIQLNVVERLVSPLLSTKYGANYGVQGQVRRHF